MPFRRRKTTGGGVELQMTAMIDIVFQLLAFFIMTFKPPQVQEGDFDIKMPVSAPMPEDTPPEDPVVPYQIRLQANASGQLTNISVGGISDFGTSFDKLHRYFLQQVQGVGGPAAGDLEAEINPDYQLHYGSSIAALTAVSGDVQNGQIVKLIEKVKFAPPGEKR